MEGKGRGGEEQKDWTSKEELKKEMRMDNEQRKRKQTPEWTKLEFEIQLDKVEEIWRPEQGQHWWSWSWLKRSINQNLVCVCVWGRMEKFWNMQNNECERIANQLSCCFHKHKKVFWILEKDARRPVFQSDHIHTKGKATICLSWRLSCVCVCCLIRVNASSSVCVCGC